jgi:uncharacterized membrane protein (UPF0127 family)
MLKSKKRKSKLSAIHSFFFILVLIATIPFHIIGCRNSNDSNQQRVAGSFTTPDNKELLALSLEVASTEYQREIGLMYRSELAEDRGMIFIYPNAKPRSFWMKNTLIPLDIIYLDSNLSVIWIVENAVPLTLESRASNGLSAQYVIEIQGGLSSKKGISIGSLFVPQSSLPYGQDGV